MFSKRRRYSATERNESESARSRFGTKTGAPVNGSDLLIPAAFTASTTLPDIAQLQQQLYAYIDDGVRSGAFDEGSAAYADQWLHEKYATWVQLLEVEYQHRADSAAWIIGGRVENLTVSFSVLMQQQSRLATLDAALRGFAAVLSGEPEAAAAAAPTTATVRAELADLPTATQLAGLGLIPAPDSGNANVIPIHPLSPAIRAVDDNTGN